MIVPAIEHTLQKHQKKKPPYKKDENQSLCFMLSFQLLPFSGQNCQLLLLHFRCKLFTGKKAFQFRGYMRSYPKQAVI